MKIFIIICNLDEQYSILDTAFRSQENAHVAITIQKRMFPGAEYQIKPIELESIEKVN